MNIQGDGSNTPLKIAYCYDQLEIIKVLVSSINIHRYISLLKMNGLF